jgi:hypothetical protein
MLELGIWMFIPSRSTKPRRYQSDGFKRRLRFVWKNHSPPRNEPVALDIKPQQTFRPMLSIIHADPRTPDHGKFFRNLRRGDEKIIAQQIMAIEAFIDLQRPAEQTRPGSLGGNIFHRLEGADQDRGRVSFPLRHHVHAEIHPVDEINIGVARRPEHDARPRRPALGGMRRQIVLAQIRLHLHDFPDAFNAGNLVDEQFPEQFPRDGFGIAVVEAARKFLHGEKYRYRTWLAVSTLFSVFMM